MLLQGRTRWWFLLGAALCLFFAGRMHGPLVRERHRHHLVQRVDSTGVPPEYVLTSAVLGGFRSLAVQLLWYRAQSMKQEGQYYEMVDIYNLITKLQPGHHQAWAFQAWDLSYNVSVEFHNLEDRVFWLFRGLDLLRVQGIPKNDDIPELPYEASWILQHKLGKTLDYAHPYYRRELAMQVEAILQMRANADAQRQLIESVARMPRHPADFDRLPGFADGKNRFAQLGVDVWGDWAEMLPGEKFRPEVRAAVTAEVNLQRTLEAVWLWRVGQQLRDHLGLDPVRMRAMNERYGAIDWRVAFAHSLYWAEMAYDIWKRKPDRKLDLKFERLVYFSLIDMSRSGRGVWGEDGFIHYLPDYTKIDAVCRHMDDMFHFFRRAKARPGETRPSLTGSYSGYHYFLRDAIYRAYFENRPAQAQRLLERIIVNDWQANLYRHNTELRLTPQQVALVDAGDFNTLREFLPISEEYQGTPHDFAMRTLSEFLDSPTVDRAQLFLESHLVSGYRALALGDMERYEFMRKMVDTVYRDYVLVRWPQKAPEFGDDLDNRSFISPLPDLKVSAVVRLLADELEDSTTAAEEALAGGGTVRSRALLDMGGTPLSPVLKRTMLARLGTREPEIHEAVLRTLRARAEAAQRQQRPAAIP